MNIKKALKEKNNLKGKINETLTRISKHNVTENGIERPYDPHLLLDELFVKIEEMVTMKTKIQKANIDVFDKIYRLSELKNVASRLKYLNCTKERIHNSPDNFSDVAISTKERDLLLENIEKQIEKIQEELDEFNYKTKI
jgi:hypothetical protein